ncbi:Uncharacterised protein [Myroides odoratimimus]|uniref:Uncharacterized protein n=1 Tax=Myroides odoratimimus CCUG 10230 TaxID=883150 RepID=A0ABP2NDP3_9FLAO|nr:hypothetical protein MYRA21_1529 [Myroides sp. A21]EHO11161.1 hypothetical protein HMPREF9712_00818 [Myroides odoratimimus CCUG 10230]STZ47074.1 Uncharacterised protein [Myroides odoratimimus]
MEFILSTVFTLDTNSLLEAISFIISSLLSWLFNDNCRGREINIKKDLDLNKFMIPLPL